MSGRFRPDIALNHGAPLLKLHAVDWQGLQSALVPSLEAAAEMFDNVALPPLVTRDSEGNFFVVDMSAWSSTPCEALQYIDAEMAPTGAALIQWAQLGIADHFPAKYREVAEYDLIMSVFNKSLQQNNFDWPSQRRRLDQATAEIASDQGLPEGHSAMSRPQAKILATLRYQDLEQTMFCHTRALGSAINEGLSRVDGFSTPPLITLPGPRHGLAQAGFLATVMQHVGDRTKATSCDSDLWARLTAVAAQPTSTYFEDSDLRAFEQEAQDCASPLKIALHEAIRRVREAAQSLKSAESNDTPKPHVDTVKSGGMA